MSSFIQANGPEYRLGVITSQTEPPATNTHTPWAQPNNSNTQAQPNTLSSSYPLCSSWLVLVVAVLTGAPLEDPACPKMVALDSVFAVLHNLPTLLALLAKWTISLKSRGEHCYLSYPVSCPGFPLVANQCLSDLPELAIEKTGVWFGTCSFS